MSERHTWTIPVCRTCYRIALWPFCVHREANGDWFTYVHATGKLPEKKAVEAALRGEQP